MGFLTWAVAGFVAFVIARLLRRGRIRSVIVELGLALGTAVAAGIVATMLDFGGWAIFDARAAAFAFAVAMASLALLRRGEEAQPQN